MTQHLLPLIALAAFACSCGDCPVSDPPPAVLCLPPPYTELQTASLSAWAEPTCTGDIGGPSAMHGSDGIEHRCVHLITGAVWCADLAAPIPDIYVPNNDKFGAPCEAWTLTTEPWYIWRLCVAPQPPDRCDELPVGASCADVTDCGAPGCATMTCASGLCEAMTVEPDGEACGLSGICDSGRCCTP